MHLSPLRFIRRLVCAVWVLTALGNAAIAFASAAVDYDNVYLRALRPPDQALSDWPEVINPTKMMPGTDLMLLHPDSSEEVLFAAGIGAVGAPTVAIFRVMSPRAAA